MHHREDVIAIVAGNFSNLCCRLCCRVCFAVLAFGVFIDWLLHSSGQNKQQDSIQRNNVSARSAMLVGGCSGRDDDTFDSPLLRQAGSQNAVIKWTLPLTPWPKDR